MGIFCDDDTIERAPNFLEWRERLVEASTLFGKPMGVAKHYKDWLAEAGFINVKEQIFKVGLVTLMISSFQTEPVLQMIGESTDTLSRFPTHLGRKTQN